MKSKRGIISFPKQFLIYSVMVFMQACFVMLGVLLKYLIAWPLDYFWTVGLFALVGTFFVALLLRFFFKFTCLNCSESSVVVNLFPLVETAKCLSCNGEEELVD